MVRFAFLSGLMIMAGAGLAWAGDIAADQAWARIAPGGTTGAVFVTLRNGGATDALIGAATDIATRAALHGHRMDGDIARMRPVDRIALPANSDTKLAPGGNHVMLFDLARKLTEGERFSLTLSFEHSAPVTVEVTVVGLGKSPDGENSGHDNHGGHSDH